MIKDVLVLGGGSAGLMAALALVRIAPQLKVRLVRSPDLGVIGVGEGTTISLPRFVFDVVRLNPAQFYREAEPTWKLGLRFLWGPRPKFDFPFSRQFNHRWPDLPKANGFYCAEEFTHPDVWTSLMHQDKAFPRGQDGRPFMAKHQHVGFHIENQKLVAYLEARCREFGVQITDGTVQQVERNDRGVAALILEDGARLTADLFVDASGFRSELLGRALQTPYLSFERALFCDRAVIGGWPRTTEPIKPYTTVETMDSGWCWQIEHEHWINRGYVYSSRFISDDAAREELMRKNPQIANVPRVVKFRAGRYATMWVDNVVGIGNASGFLEPLEASALATIGTQVRSLAVSLVESDYDPPPSMIALYNRYIAEAWDEIRDFIAIHYRFNTRLETPFWQACRSDTELAGAGPLVEFFQENGPSVLHQTSMLRRDHSYGIEGYLTLLIGQQVPYRKKYQPSPAEWQAWQNHCAHNAMVAQHGFTVSETLAAIRRPDWQW